MFMHPEIAGQLIRDRQRQMLADRNQQHLRRRPAAARRAHPAASITGRLAGAARLMMSRRPLRGTQQ